MPTCSISPAVLQVRVQRDDGPPDPSGATESTRPLPPVAARMAAVMAATTFARSPSGRDAAEAAGADGAGAAETGAAEGAPLPESEGAPEKNLMA